MTDTHVTDLHWRERDAFLHRMVTEDPTHVYFAQTVPPGYDAEVDRLRKLGQVQIFKQQRPVRIRDVDNVAHRLVRKG